MRRTHILLSTLMLFLENIYFSIILHTPSITTTTTTGNRPLIYSNYEMPPLENTREEFGQQKGRIFVLGYVYMHGRNSCMWQLK